MEDVLVGGEPCDGGCFRLRLSCARVPSARVCGIPARGRRSVAASSDKRAWRLIRAMGTGQVLTELAAVARELA